MTTTGTDTIGTETITNSDAIDVTGGTLTLAADTVNNNGAVTVSGGAALVAKDGTTITNGAGDTITVNGSGSLTAGRHVLDQRRQGDDCGAWREADAQWQEQHQR